MHGLAASGFGDEIAAFAGDTTVVVIGFAAGNGALVVFELKGFEAL